MEHGGQNQAHQTGPREDGQQTNPRGLFFRRRDGGCGRTGLNRPAQRGRAQHPQHRSRQHHRAASPKRHPPSGQGHGRRAESIGRQGSRRGSGVDGDAGLVLLHQGHTFGEQPDDGRPDHGLKQAVGRPQDGHGPSRSHAHSHIAPRRKQQSRRNHPKGRNPLAQQAAEHLPHGVADKISGGHGPRRREAENSLGGDGRHDGGIVVPAHIGGRIGRPAEQEQAPALLSGFQAGKGPLPHAQYGCQPRVRRVRASM